MQKLAEIFNHEIVGLGGRIGIVIEIKKQRYQINGDAIFPSASLIKIPILLHGLRLAEQGRINLNHSMPISNRVGGSGVLRILSNQASLTVKDLLTLMITVSDNTATNMVVDLFGKDSINNTMRDLGLKNSRLNRKMMDFEAARQGHENRTSPSDMLTCLKIINEGDILTDESRRIAIEIMQGQQFLDKLPAMLNLDNNDQLFIANKTGSLPGVEHDCAIFKFHGKTAYAAVLTDQQSDTYAARQVISKIGSHVVDFLIEE